MNRVQLNRLAMFIAVNKVFPKYTEAINSIKILSDKVAEFQQKTGNITELMKVQENKITGAALQKQKEEEEMINTTLQLAGGLYVYALDIDNIELANQLKVSPRGLQKLNDSVLATTCYTINHVASVIAPEVLADYGISAELIANQKKETDDFNAVIGNPRSAIVVRSEATRQIAEEMKEAKELLTDRIDKLMTGFQFTNPTFYGEYQSARIIVDLRATAPGDADSSEN